MGTGWRWTGAGRGMAYCCSCTWQWVTVWRAGTATFSTWLAWLPPDTENSVLGFELLGEEVGGNGE